MGMAKGAAQGRKPVAQAQNQVARLAVALSQCPACLHLDDRQDFVAVAQRVVGALEQQDDGRVARHLALLRRAGAAAAA